MFKRFIIAVLVLLIPSLLFISVWQSYRYNILMQEVSALEQEQKEIFEMNKKNVMGIEFLKSPFRINKIADEDLDLQKVDPSRILRIEFSQKENQDG